MLDKSIKKLGKFIRSEVERWIKGNPDIDQYDLAGACAIASYTIYRCLIKLGYNPKFIMADSGCGCHCWVELNDTVIDLTATQFNFELPKVLTSKKKYYFKRVPILKDYTEHYINRSAVKYTKTWDQQSPIIYSRDIRKLVRNLNVENYI